MLAVSKGHQSQFRYCWWKGLLCWLFLRGIKVSLGTVGGRACYVGCF